MKSKFIIIVGLFFLAFIPKYVGAQSNLAIDIASNHIDVTVGFTGSSIVLFGDRRSEDTDIAIVVEGPEKDVTLWEKKRVMGAWVNRHNVKFESIPVYYNYSISTSEVDDRLKHVMQQNGIGHDALFKRIRGEVDKDEVEKRKSFEKAYVEKSAGLGVYFQTPAEMKFINSNFFRVNFKIPPSAPTGQYKIKSYLIKDGRVIDQALNLLVVEQVGLNAFIFQSAHDYSFVYAIVCVTLALFFGWLVSVLRVKP